MIISLTPSTRLSISITNGLVTPRKPRAKTACKTKNVSYKAGALYISRAMVTKKTLRKMWVK